MSVQYQKELEEIQKDEDQYNAFMQMGHTVLQAGPGSGKTKVLTLKIYQLLRDHIKTPRGLACITFSKEAATEFTTRLQNLGFTQRENVFLGTIHAFCISHIITPFSHLYPELEIPSKLIFISTKRQNEILVSIQGEIGYHGKITFEEISKERQNIDGFSEVKIRPYELAQRIALLYEKRLKAAGLVDFDSIVIYATKLVKEPLVQRYLQGKFPWLLIDEYQDLGKPLHEIVLTICRETKIKVFAVGDCDQSIYSFNGAHPDFLIELSREADFADLKLSTNYRSHPDIVKASEVCLKEARGYKANNSRSGGAEFRFISCQQGMDEQYDLVVEKLLPHYLHKSISHEEIAVVLKSRKEAKALAKYFVKKGIPFYLSNGSFEKSEVVRWLEHCAKWCCNPQEYSFEKLFVFWNQLFQSHGGTSSDLLNRIFLYRCLTNNRETITKKWFKQLLKDLQLIELLGGSTAFPDEVENLSNLKKELDKGAYGTLAKFSHLSKPIGQVTISTRHGIKGLEFEVVILLGLEEGNLPDWRDIENGNVSEARRLFFVCVSRAKVSCIFVWSFKHYIYNGKYNELKEYKASSFIYELYENLGKREYYKAKDFNP